MTNTFAGYPLINPQRVRQERGRFRRDHIPELDLANSYYSLAGHYPDVGWLLLDRASYDRLDRYATNHSLVISDFNNPTLTVSNLAIVQARCVTRGTASDPNAIYLIQVTNSQGVIYNPWFQLSVNVQYNVRALAYPGKFYDWSLDQSRGGTTWTWDTMLRDLWERAPSQLGTYPGLPYVPDGLPENHEFIGVSLWGSIGKVLDYLGLSVVGNYPNFSIVQMGAADSTFTALQSLYSTNLEDDYEYIDGGSGRVPSQVTVYFHRRNEYYGSEETVRYDSLQWQSTPAYEVTVSGPGAFTSAAGTGHLWSEFTVRYDQNGSPLAADVATANNIARQRVSQFYDDIFRGTHGFMKQCYSGVLPFTTGSLVDGVRWFNTDASNTRAVRGGYGGWHTEIIRGHVWKEATFDVSLEGFVAD